jgi:cytidylate kinase
MQKTIIPILAIDGPSASGKGTIAKILANQLGFHYLDSGSLYRIVAWVVQQEGLKHDDLEPIIALTQDLDIRYDDDAVWVRGDNITHDIRRENVGLEASALAQIPQIRQALYEKQRAFAELPGLVADGRDMGSVIFPEAQLKVFLTADVHQRAIRRYKQLISQAKSANLADIQADLERRDIQDRHRVCAPLVAVPDARVIDSSSLTIDEVVSLIYRWWQEQQ